MDPEHELIMALTAQPDTQDACGIGSGPFAAPGCAEVKVAVLGDSPGPEEYLQHINSFLRNLSRKKINAKMTKTKLIIETKG